jgi:hypothetical protein
MNVKRSVEKPMNMMIEKRYGYDVIDHKNYNEI